MNKPIEIEHWEVIVDYTADFNGDIRDLKHFIKTGDRVRVIRRTTKK